MNEESANQVSQNPAGDINSSADNFADDEKDLTKQISQITDELDKESDKESKQVQTAPEDKKEEKENQNLSKIEDSLKHIKASISSQRSIVNAINNTNEGSLRSLGIIQDIFLAQNELLRKQQEIKKNRELEAALEKGSDLSKTDKATSTMDDGEAEAEVVKVDGDVLTIKPIDGNFKEGQRITTGKGGGFDLLGMIKNIASRFRGKKQTAGVSSPTKMSKGGIALGPKKLASGGFQPGIYDKPTVGNLAPGQAVIPLNRNVGKNILGRNTTKLQKKHQPLADVMQQPIKAIGGAIIAMSGNVIRSLGALAGFFTPYIQPLLGALGKALGIPLSIVESLLGGPAYSATLDLKKQTNIFSDIWSSIMEKFDFGFGVKKEKTKTKPKTKPGRTIQGGDADFWSLAAVASLEGASPQGEADVAQVIYNRVASGVYGGKTIKDIILSPGQFQPVTYDGADLNKWKAITDRESAIAAVATHKGKGIETATKYVDEGAANIINPALQKSAAEFVGGRTDFAVPSAANKYPGGFGYVERHGHLFGWYVGPGSIAYGKTNPGPAPVPAFPISAEKGASVSQGKPVDAFTLTGPNSGYEVPGIGEMHGKEAVIRYEKGFTILPIENRLFSMETDPLNTIMRWKQLLGPAMDSPASRKFAAGGKVTLYAGHADMTADSAGGKGTNGGPRGDAPKIPEASGYFTTEAYLNDKIAAMAASKSGGIAEYRAPVRTKNGTDPNSNWERAKNDVAAGNTPIEIHHDAETGKAGLITKSQGAINSNKYFNALNSSFGFYRTGSEGFVNRGGAILEVDALKPHMRTNPSAWISSASTKLANSLKRNSKTDDTTIDDSINSDTASATNEVVEEDPFKRIEGGLKSMAIGFALNKGFETGEIKDEESYKRVKESVTKVIDSAVIPKPSPAIQATPSSQPSVQIVPGKGGERMVMVGTGRSAKPVGKIINDMCVPNYG